MLHPRNPCSRDCPERKLGCHGECEAYKEFYRSNRMRCDDNMQRKGVSAYVKDTSMKLNKKFNRR